MQQSETFKEIDKFLEDREALRKHVNFISEFHNISPEEEEKWRDWLVDVLEAAGNDIFPVLADLQVIVITKGGCCRRDAHTPSGERWIEGLQIILPDLSDCSEQAAKQAVAVQLAHAALLHWKIRNEKVSKKVQEVNDKAADILAASWGFEKEEKDQEN